MTFQATTDQGKRVKHTTREDALAWARGIVADGIRVVRLRSGKARRADAALSQPGPTPASEDRPMRAASAAAD